MADRLTELLLKAVRLLPPSEQDEVLGALLDGTLRMPASGAEPSPGGGAVLLEGSGDVLRRMQPLGTLDSLGAVGPADADTALRVLPVRLPLTDYERLRAFSRQHGFSMAVIIRTLVERFLDGQARRWAPADSDDELDDGGATGHA